jgi:diguanylate cyclase (GGDEF)-like protein/PAS domain S-box-containing protein
MTREGKGMSSRPDASAVEPAVMAGAEPDFPALVRALRDLADSFHHGVAAAVFLVDVGDDGAFRYAGLNRLHEHSTGLTSAQIRGKSPRDLVPDVLTEAHADAVTANYRRCVEARCPIEYEEHLALAGRATWWVTRLVPLFDASGRVARIVGTAWDITVQKRLELDADARQRRFRAVFELSVEAKFLADNEGRYVDVNSATERLLGYTRVELLGMSVWDLLPHPDAEAGRVQWKEFLRSGQLSGEARLRRKDGTLVPVEFEAVANVLDGIHLSVCRDLTARKASEQAAEFARRQLEEAHARLNGMMEALPHPVAAFEADGRIVACNTAYSREVERLYGRTVRPGDSVVEAASHCQQDVDRVVALLARVFDGEQLSVLAEFGDPALGRKLYQIELSPILGGAGKVAGAAFLAYDVTDRARAETALRESEARFRDMAANLPGVVYQWFERADGNRGFRWVSPRLKEIFAVEPQQMDRVADLIHPEDRDRWLASIVEANRDGGIWSFEGRLLYPDGAVKWWQGISRQSQVTDEEIVYNGVMLDISDRKAAEDELRLAAKVFEHSREGIVILAADCTVLSVNRAFTTITGHVPEDVLGGPLAALDVLRGDARQGAVWERVRTAGAWEGEQLLERRNGEVFPARVQLLALRSDGGTSRHFVVILEDISERKAQEERIRHMAQHDFLTGLPNRALLEDRLRQAMPLAVRQGGRLAVMFLDLDRFKTINDSLGHQVGDTLLQEVGRRLSSCVRMADTVSRQGGDEFVVLVQDLDGPDAAAGVARKILDVVAEPYAVDGTQLSVTPSIGISVFPDDGHDIATLLRNADVAMYHAKAAGRNNFQFFTREMNARVRERVAMETRLRRALQKGSGFALHYQPRIDLHTGAVAGMEALLRWHDPDLGDVAPAAFIPVAEESGLILQIGEWVLREACRQNRAWQRAGLPVMPVSVNLSAVQFRQAALEQLVMDALRDADLPPECLELEVTETSIMHDMETVRGTLEALRSGGIRLSIDDFGTGYSSLAYLKRLPLDRLKIDRSFVQDVPNDTDDAAIAAAIVGMAQTLGLRTLAEGIETTSQLEFLRRLGCEEAQGFLFSRPLPPDAFVAWVRGSAGVRF